jgi:transcriptional antiterminator RfaH
MSEWGVCVVATACENKASADLMTVGFSSYFPRYESTEALSGQIVRRVRPLFPGYLFFVVTDLWRRLFDFDHIIGVLRWAEDRPAALPQEVIDELHEREGPDGVIRLEERKRRRYRVGQSVRMKHGPFIGFSGIVESPPGVDRVKVLFEMLGRQTPVTVSETELAA